MFKLLIYQILKKKIPYIKYSQKQNPNKKNLHIKKIYKKKIYFKTVGSGNSWRYRDRDK